MTAGHKLERGLREMFPSFPPAPPSWDLTAYTTWIHDALDFIHTEQRRLEAADFREKLLTILASPETAKET